MKNTKKLQAAIEAMLLKKRIKISEKTHEDFGEFTELNFGELNLKIQRIDLDGNCDLYHFNDQKQAEMTHYDVPLKLLIIPPVKVEKAVNNFKQAYVLTCREDNEIIASLKVNGKTNEKTVLTGLKFAILEHYDAKKVSVKRVKSKDYLRIYAAKITDQDGETTSSKFELTPTGEYIV